jgi:nitrite reductase/ring-hydroxylating ferredoxin subunit
MFTTTKIANTLADLEFNSNNMCQVQVDNFEVTVGIYNDTLFAFASKCPHASGIMANGFIDGLGNVVCPLHKYKFSLKNGKCTSDEGYFLKCYEVEQNNLGIFIKTKNKF